MFEELRPAIQSTNETRMMVKFKNGSRLTFKGAENEKSLRGRGLTYCVVDEGAYVDRAIWTRAIRPSLSDRAGKAIICSTPAGRANWFYDQYVIANENRNGWSAFRWMTSDNPLIGQDDLNDAKAQLSASEYQQEYLAEFVSSAGLVLPDFSDKNIVEPFHPTASEYNIYLSIDPGWQVTAIGFFAVPKLLDHVVHAGKAQVFQFDELYLQQRDIQAAISDIHRVLASHGLAITQVKNIAIDPAANKVEQSSGISIPAILRQEGFMVIERGSLVKEGLALMRSFVHNANGIRRFFVTSNCREFIRCYQSHQYRMDNRDRPTDEPLKDGLTDHAVDSSRYFFINKFDLGKDVFRFCRLSKL
jgi:hypothetical protein